MNASSQSFPLVDSVPPSTTPTQCRCPETNAEIRADPVPACGADGAEHSQRTGF